MSIISYICILQKTFYQLRRKSNCQFFKNRVYLYVMLNKNYRLQLIKDFIANERIESQEDLLSKLQEEGITLTQATLSRDLKLLKVAKVADTGGYRYIINGHHEPSSHRKEYLRDIARGLISVSFSGNIGVIKTQTGHADSVALAIDRLNIPDILGTIAGDDTIFFVINNESRKSDILAYLSGENSDKESE